MRRVLQQPYVRWLVLAAFVVGVGFQGTRLNQFQNSMEVFDSAVQFSAKNGETLQDALSRPVVAQEDAHSIHIENSLRYDFEKAVTAWKSLSPGLGPLIESIPFSSVFLSLVAACVGVVLSTSEKNSGMLKVRMCLLGRRRGLPVADPRASFRDLRCGGCNGVWNAARCFRYASRIQCRKSPSRSKRLDVFPDVSVVWVAFLASLFMVFLAAFAGRAIGLLIGSAAICSSIMVLGIVALPILGVWDPRNGAAVLMKPATSRLSGSSVFSSYDMSNQAAFFSLVVWVTGALIISAVLFWRISPFRK
ncbi:hypothetical protein [Dermatophilus congolensis]|uniref:hypothetical protein n=1 Tax=Dermatophilus congolensis TaxID=1863 RepID=UPI0011C05EBF|nr:hypothetical protein [Dermatophilus congolensis]